jgi:hypothetical protein
VTPSERPRISSRSRRLLALAIGLPLCHITGTAWHEIVGHGLTGTMFGATITEIHVMGVQLWPSVRWEGWTGQYGSCDMTEIPSAAGRQWMSLGGSLSTWLVAVIAAVLLWSRRWRGWPRFVLLWLSLWWIDMFTYTLPTWGLRRSILWGGTYSEPYEAAVKLGMPGAFFQALVIISSILLAANTTLVLLRSRRTAADANASIQGIPGTPS